MYLEYLGIWNYGLSHAYWISCLVLSYVEFEQTMNPQKCFYMIYFLESFVFQKQGTNLKSTILEYMSWFGKHNYFIPFIPLYPILTFCFPFHNIGKARTWWILNNSIHEHLQEFEMAVWTIHIKAPCYLLLLWFQTERFLFLRRFGEWLICVYTRICMRTRLFLCKQERPLFLGLKGYTNPISDWEEYPLT